VKEKARCHEHRALDLPATFGTFECQSESEAGIKLFALPKRGISMFLKTRFHNVIALHLSGPASRPFGCSRIGPRPIWPI
jgi:hypothetical protein